MGIALFSGISADNTPYIIFKDIFLLLFILLPFGINYKLINPTKYYKFTWLIVYLGMLFSFILYFFIATQGFAYINTINSSLSIFGLKFENLHGLMHEPIVLFSSIFLTLYGLYSSKKNKAKLLLSLVGLIMILPMFLAPFRFVIAIYISIVFLYFIKYFKKLSSYFYLFIFLVIFTIIFFQQIMDAVDLIYLKSITTGTAQKSAELVSILKERSIYEYLFGGGFGSAYYNPVFDAKIIWTHTLFSYIFLKTGLIGLILIGSPFLLLLFKLLKKIFLEKNHIHYIISASCLLPLANSLFFQPDYIYGSYIIIIIISIYITKGYRI